MGLWKALLPQSKMRSITHTAREPDAPVLNEDARSHWLGRDNVGYTTIEGKQMPVLLDTEANINMITPECVVALGLQMGPSHRFA